VRVGGRAGNAVLGAERVQQMLAEYSHLAALPLAIVCSLARKRGRKESDVLVVMTERRCLGLIGRGQAWVRNLDLNGEHDVVAWLSVVRAVELVLFEVGSQQGVGRRVLDCRFSSEVRTGHRCLVHVSTVCDQSMW
jgi:hypothetical protein